MKINNVKRVYAITLSIIILVLFTSCRAKTVKKDEKIQIKDIKELIDKQVKIELGKEISIINRFIANNTKTTFDSIVEEDRDGNKKKYYNVDIESDTTIKDDTIDIKEKKTTETNEKEDKTTQEVDQHINNETQVEEFSIFRRIGIITVLVGTLTVILYFIRKR